MDEYRRLKENLRNVLQTKESIVYQGIVKAVDDNTCTVNFGSIDVDGVRLRASSVDIDKQMLITPCIGSAVCVASLSGDLSQLVVIAVDKIDTIVINGGELGGLVNIEALTDKINALIDAFNNHTHQLLPGSVSVTGSPTSQSNPAPIQVPAIQQKAQKFKAEDYEDETIKH